MEDEAKARATRAEPGDPTADGSATSAYATTEPGDSTAGATIVPTWGAADDVALPDPGYQLGELIGRGGMGEVVAARDQRIGRDVAVKRIRARTGSTDATMRFLREARIQARLDHPAIVPVYELGTDADGRPYFTMKRLTGETLMKKLAAGEPIQPLLRAFVDVCHAIRLAHARGVVHRDLKPSNIMLGEYGEVYVLDWGVARVLTDRRRATQPSMAIDIADDGTTAGAILGTPGYMAPEQIQSHEVGPPADIYALGAILFEILAGESLHPRGEAALATTLTRPQAAPAQRAAERAIPPELDAVCFAALAERPEARPSARELADRVQAYIDGDRDVERRRELAVAQLSAAREALASEADDGRATALRRAGRALALDPSSAEAAELVTKLLVEPPPKLPPVLVASLEHEQHVAARTRGRNAMWAYLSVFGFWFMIPFLDVRSWPPLLSFYGLVGLLAAAAYRYSRFGVRSAFTTFVLNFLALLVFTRIASPFVLTPIVTMGVLLWFAADPTMSARPWAVLGWAIAVVLVPLALESIGWLPSTWRVEHDSLRTHSDFFVLHGRADEIALVVANLGFVLIASWFALVANRARHAAQRELHIQHWQLRQLLPGSTAAAPPARAE